MLRGVGGGRSNPPAYPITIWAANWVGPGRGHKSTRPGANGVVELSPFEFLDRLADLESPPLAPARGPPTDWGELLQAHDD